MIRQRMLSAEAAAIGAAVDVSVALLMASPFVLAMALLLYLCR